MDGLPGLIMLFIVIGVMSRLSNAAKRKGNFSNQQGKRPAGEAPQPAKARPVSTEGVGTPEILRAMQAARQASAPAAKQPVKQAAAPGAANPAASRVPEKTSIEQAVGPRQTIFADKEGCIGGSMAHTQHEGEGKAEHALHMKRAASAQPLPAVPASSLRSLRVEDLRRAVVMSEILDKPKALRR